MKKIRYTVEAATSLVEIKQNIRITCNAKQTKKIMDSIKNTIKLLKKYNYMGIPFSEQYDIETDYYYIYSNKNYIIYRIEEKEIIIIDLINEKEDHIYKLFNIKIVKDDNE